MVTKSVDSKNQAIRSARVRCWPQQSPSRSPFLGQNKGADSEVVAMLQRHFNAR